MAIFVNANGNQTFRGTDAEYDQVDYAGSLADYTFTQNNDGSVTVSHPNFGTDILTNIEGLWFQGEASWYSIEDALGVPSPIVEGTNGDDVQTGTNIDNTFIGSAGDDLIDGNGGGYNQVDYSGALADYTFTQNNDGSVTAVHATLGTDILTDIDGLWFTGEQSWYSLADVVETDGPNNNPLQTGTNGDDTLTGANINNTFIGSRGDDTLDGNGGAYNQVDYTGALEDYNFVQNADGTTTVSHPVMGTDTLTDIDGLWFQGEAQWYSLADAIAASATEAEGGTLINGVYTGTNAADALIGGNTATVFYAGMGTDSITGNSNNDTLNVDGDVVEWTLTENADGSTDLSHATWGVNTVSGIEQIMFGRSGTPMTIAEAVEATDGLPAFRLDADGVINGTPGDDIMTGNAQTQLFYGGVGDDSYNGRDGYDQINYDGNRSEYDITQNVDGTYTLAHEIWGTDTIENIEGLYFNGNNEWIAVSDLFGAA